MNIIKSTSKAVAALSLVAAISACGNDWLDREPGNGISQEKALVSTNNLNTARIGLYQALKGRNSNYVDYYGAKYFVYAEMRGEDMQYNSAYGSARASFWYRMEGNTPEDFNYSNATWRSPNIIIARANRIINAVNNGSISDNSSSTDSLITLCRDEAKVLRAMAIFDLTRIYGKPYTQDQGASWGAAIDTTNIEPEAKVMRSTVADCYKQVLKDLNDTKVALVHVNGVDQAAVFSLNVASVASSKAGDGSLTTSTNVDSVSVTASSLAGFPHLLEVVVEKSFRQVVVKVSDLVCADLVKDTTHLTSSSSVTSVSYTVHQSPLELVLPVHHSLSAVVSLWRGHACVLRSFLSARHLPVLDDNLGVVRLTDWVLYVSSTVVSTLNCFLISRCVSKRIVTIYQPLVNGLLSLAFPEAGGQLRFSWVEIGDVAQKVFDDRRVVVRQ